MKKILLSIAMALSLVACGDDPTYVPKETVVVEEPDQAPAQPCGEGEDCKER